MLIALLFKVLFPKNKASTATIMIGVSWIWGFALALPPLFGFGSYAVEANGLGCAPTWNDPKDFDYNIMLFSVGFFLPLSIIIITNIDLFHIIHKVGLLYTVKKI